MEGEISKVDIMIKELFATGAMMYFLSIFSSIFNPQVSKMLKTISYFCIAFFILLILFQLWETVNHLIEVLDNLSKWWPDLNPFN